MARRFPTLSRPERVGRDRALRKEEEEERMKWIKKERQVGAYLVEELHPAPRRARGSGPGRPPPLVVLLLTEPARRWHGWKRAWAEMRRTAPYAWRLFRDTATLVPGRTAVLMIAIFLKGVVPAFGIEATRDLIACASDAAAHHRIDRLRIFKAAFLSVGVVALERALQRLVEHNDDIVDRNIHDRLQLAFLSAVLRLDLPTWEDPEVSAMYADAAHVVNMKPFQVILEVVRQGSQLVSLLLRMRTVRRAVNDGSRSLVLLCFLRSLLMYWSSWEFRNPYSARLVDPNALRMQTMSQIANDPSLRRDVQLYGLRRYIIEEYRRAAKAIDVPTRFQHPELLHQNVHQLVRKALDAAVYVIFALKATRDPLASFANLSFLQSVSTEIVYESQHLMQRNDNLRRRFDHVKALYDMENLRPTLAPVVADGEEPFVYCAADEASGDGSGDRGMKIEFRHVSFTYPGKETPALEDISFTIHPGEVCVLVGSNGAGKSTIITLMTRLYDASDGLVLINDRDVRSYEPESLRAAFSVLSQNLHTFPVTIRENLILGSPKLLDGSPPSVVSDDEVQGAVRAAGLEGVLEKLPKGLDANLEPLETTRGGGLVPLAARGLFTGPEDMPKLSGGEWQKLGIARAWMRNKADALVFDEPSASLDPQAEWDLFERLRGLTHKTIAYTTHRFASTRFASRILVVEGGKLVENGSHAELMGRDGGRYRHLYSLSSRGFVDG